MVSNDEARALVTAFHAVSLSPEAASSVGLMLTAGLNAAQTAQRAVGGSFFDTEPAGFLVKLDRHAGRTDG